MLPSAISSQTGFAHLTDLPCLQLQHRGATAIVSLYGGQILSYKAAPHREILWLSEQADWHDNKPIRGGIPVCWPWFGPAPDTFASHSDTALPNHGLVRTRLWQLLNQSVADNAVSITLGINVNDIPGVSQPVNLSLTVTLTDTLAVSLQCDSAILQQAALHSYFATDNISTTTVSGLGQTYQDKLSNTLCTDADTVLCIAEEVDRVYQQPEAQLCIKSAQSNLHIEQRGTDATIAWNPWQDKSRRTVDMPDDSYQHFICVESARLQLSTPAALALSQQFSQTLSQR